MPAEWTPHERCWMAWPCRRALWDGEIESARDAYTAVARAVARFEPVMMAARPTDAADAARRLRADPPTAHPISIFECEIDDSWARDSGPTFVVRDSAKIAAAEKIADAAQIADAESKAQCRGAESNATVAAVDWRFNGWGGKYDCQNDDRFAARVAARACIPRFRAPLAMEGGAFCVDGEGTLLTTEQCLLHPNRNPHLSRAEIEESLRAFLGIEKIVWLAGDPADDETDGHIDELACFARPGLVLAMRAQSRDSPSFAALEDNLARLAKTRDARGRNLQIVELPQPEVERRGRRLLASYINFYFANGGAVIPEFNCPTDAAARAILADALPGRKIAAVNARAIAIGGGGIHCITQQQPTARANPRNA